jgi:biopolymer transport protein ExbB
MTRPLSIITSLLLLCPAILYAQEVETVAEESLSLWGMIKQGGWAMYPLGLCSLTMFFLILHCWRETNKPKFVPQKGLDQAASAFALGQIEIGLQTLAQTPSVLTRAMTQSLANIKTPLSDRKREKAEASLVESLEGEENSIGQWINYLNVIAAVAPMIGLLGTVSGMIGAFQTMAKSGMGRPELFAGNIGEALITTATGLVIGIPSMVCFFVMRNRLNNGMLVSVQSANALMDSLEATMEESPGTAAGSQTV